MVAMAGVALPAHAQSRALIVGIDSFSDPELSGKESRAAAADIAAMKKLLIDTLRFKKENIKILRGKAATKQAVLEGLTDWLRPDKKEVEERFKDEEAIKSGKLKKKQIRALRKKWAKLRRKPNRSYFYYSGLGYSRRDIDGDEADGYDEAIIPHDVQVIGSGSSTGLAGLISDDEFSQALKTLEGRRVTVVLDTSYSTVANAPHPEPSNDPVSRSLRLPGADATNEKESKKPSRFGAGHFVETRFAKGTLAVWEAASAGQSTFTVRTQGTGKGDTPKASFKSIGLFTQAYTGGLNQAKADLNGNGIVSSVELLLYLRTRMESFCKSHASRCPAGLTPQLYPEVAYGLRTGKGRRRRGKLSFSHLTDFLITRESNGKNAEGAPTIERLSQVPLKVGSGNIRFRISAPRDGKLVLLNLSPGGRLSQLYPNHFTSNGNTNAQGLVLANKPLVIPDPDYGLEFTVTDPGKGHVIALYASDEIEFGETVSDHSIGNIPRSEAVTIYLPKVAAALLRSVRKGDSGETGDMANWSVTVLEYEILP